MSMRLRISVVETEADLRACHPVMEQLRSGLAVDAFVEQVQRQRLLGYRLVAGRLDDGMIVVLAGFVLGEKLAWGRHLYVDDLVTDRRARSLGAGRAMIAWLKAYALECGCETLHLDSGLHRTDAHRFYERMGLTQRSGHFSVRLRGAVDRARSAEDGGLAAEEGDGPVVAEGPSEVQLRSGAGPLGENTLYPDVDDEDSDLDPSHEGGLDPDFR